MTRRLIALAVALGGANGFAQVVPGTAYSASTFSTLAHGFDFEATIGTFLPDGRLAVATRETAGPTTPHRVLAVNADGSDTIIGPESNYPSRFHVLWEIGFDLSDAAAPILCLDAGIWSPNSPPDGFLTRLNPTTGTFTFVTLPTSFINPRAIARFSNGDLLIGDVGRHEVANDGRLVRLIGGVGVFNLTSGVDVFDAIVLPDQTVVWAGRSGTVDGVFAIPPGGQQTTMWTLPGVGPEIYLAHNEGDRMPRGVYVNAGYAVYLLRDNDANLVAESTETVCAGRISSNIAFDASGRLYVMDGATYTIVRVEKGCAVDFDGDGFITGKDFDAFVQAFELGC